jgi:hypothetical protein
MSETCAGGCTFWKCGRVSGHSGPCYPAPPPAPIEVVDVLGNRLPIARRYGDGSFDCPHCHYPVVVPALECSNPWCPANPAMPKEAAAEILRKAAAEERDRRERAEMLAASRRRVEEERAHRAAVFAELMKTVEAAGACKRCAIRAWERSGRPKVVRHRKPCPLEK